ncbi:hypothetical protein OE766_16080 [Pararhizobium sp. YC-54]|uniref:hypothetical protein n=1 Tax=Pararhizobium sp. YC-54 TaxID=2986920 RepID=UPI0021F6A688|nr:hypothetical protein [Pararhizobium sp. YC-54]MCV9999759.1 hypothetical protein [Pararhizobium sp. YC-54]
MATFNVTKGSGATPEVEGAAFAAQKLIDIYPQYESGQLDASELFTEWMLSVIGVTGVTVTYGDGAAVVSKNGGKIFALINGDQIRLRLKADDDDFKRKKVLMITPASKPNIGAQYLINAVNWIKAEPDPTKAQAFLLGTILLKRCR